VTVHYSCAARHRLNGLMAMTTAATLPKHIYNPITAMGFSAMFTFQLDSTRRKTLPAPHCRNGSCTYIRVLSAKSVTTASQNMQYLVYIYNFETALHAQREPRHSVSKANQGRLGESWKKFFLHALHSMLYPHVNKAATGAELKTLLKPRPYAFLQLYRCTRAGVCCGPCNPSK
jgi:hypothetical protein